MFLNHRLSLLAFRSGSDTRPHLDLGWMHLCEVRMLLKSLEIPILEVERDNQSALTMFLDGTLSIQSAYWMAHVTFSVGYYSAVSFLCVLIFLVALQKVIKGFSNS